MCSNTYMIMIHVRMSLRPCRPQLLRVLPINSVNLPRFPLPCGCYSARSAAVDLTPSSRNATSKWTLQHFVILELTTGVS